MTLPNDNEKRAATGRPAGVLTPARIVALALVALVAAGLASLYVGRGEDAVSVPAGARAGDLTLEPCDYATEDGAYASDCGTLVVPENRHDAGSRLIALPLTRIRSQSPSSRPPIFYLEGGPGITNMEFPEASRFPDHRDVVLVGYRGVDGSVRLDCPEVASSRERSRDWLSTASLEADVAAFRACADRLRDDGVDLAATRSRSGSTTSSSPGARWATGRSTSSARASARASR